MEKIFGDPSIKLILAEESAKFVQVNKFWEVLMNETAKSQKAELILKKRGREKLVKELKDMNARLDDINNKL